MATGNIGYLVLGAPRSGTNLLCHALHATGEAGEPDEWYGLSRLHRRLLRWGLAHPDSRQEAPRATDWPAYRQRLAERAAGEGRFGVKVFPYHVDPLFRSGQLSSPVDLLPTGYRADIRVIVVSRRDVVAQAVSMAIASRTGVFADVPGDVPVRVPTRVAWWREGPPPALVPEGHRLTADAFDPAEIHQIVAGVRRQHAVWAGWLAATRFPRLSVTYEDLVDRRELVLQSAFDLLGMSARAVDHPDSGLRRQATALNGEIGEAYREWLGARPAGVEGAAR
ncbi:Stf0 family sulfotransferase [Streptosporangium soli]|nr:Stf0 sulfotransferase family protein [Streptosporangium sp. KLBMP 9127]